MSNVLSTSRFHYQLARKEQRGLIHSWLAQPYVEEWFYGQGLQNTIDHLDQFFLQSAQAQYWIAYDNDRPFAFFITSYVEKPDDELTQWCSTDGTAITLDMLIGETDYLGKGLADYAIKDFLRSQFLHASEVLIDPEKTNARAVHVYQKAGFTILSEFIPSHSPNPHYMMRLTIHQ